MKIEGYVLVKHDAKIISAAPDKDFQGKTLRVMEFGVNNCALVINNEANALATIEPEDILKSFRCSQHGDIICPPNLNPIEQTMYCLKASSRKGGYNYIVGQMVIVTSMHKGEFCDSILWVKQ